ncbi:hypothetical protein GQ588_07390 [Dehalobacter restrictus]|uniref:Uncharacterized protein n=1 Tax=Dehalobacter restrictus TaxID=55583 RepID=A0A857DI48_9FIRM|nr:hypothetical protein GQ588_07390 [Dehalobacter restrictus]
MLHDIPPSKILKYFRIKYFQDIQKQLNLCIIPCHNNKNNMGLTDKTHVVFIILMFQTRSIVFFVKSS